MIRVCKAAVERRQVLNSDLRVKDSTTLLQAERDGSCTFTADNYQHMARRQAFSALLFLDKGDAGTFRSCRFPQSFMPPLLIRP